MQIAGLTQSMRAHFEETLRREAHKLYPTDSSLHQACRYAMAGQGKRIRPLLLYLSYQACGGENWQALDLPALAIELVHTYSLVHDDLPCMDDDDLRRGRPTVHKAFDEATALLVGDALLTDAFHLLSYPSDLAAADQLRLLAELAQAVGGRGMVLGQALDLHWTGRGGYGQSDLDQIHRLKTGRLIAAACVMGAVAAACGDDDLTKMRSFGDCLGLAFQIRDDVLDQLPTTGKTQGKDEAQQKLTYLQMMSQREAQERALDLTGQAFAAIEHFGVAADGLRSLASALLERRI